MGQKVSNVYFYNAWVSLLKSYIINETVYIFLNISDTELLRKLNKEFLLANWTRWVLITSFGLLPNLPTHHFAGSTDDSMTHVCCCLIFTSNYAGAGCKCEGKTLQILPCSGNMIELHTMCSHFSVLFVKLLVFKLSLLNYRKRT